MQVVLETAEQIDRRLQAVLRSAELEVLPGKWSFEEFATSEFDARADRDALGLIRDGDRWSQLVPAKVYSKEVMLVWGFHFEADINNSGFVGWLATRIKAETGSGVAVICGQNSTRGGIFDYWCCPEAARSEVLSLIHSMRREELG